MWRRRGFSIAAQLVRASAPREAPGIMSRNMSGPAVVVTTAMGKDGSKVRSDGKLSAFRSSCRLGGLEIISDEPEKYGGAGEGPDPYDLLLAGLGSCTTMTIKMYADKKGLTRLEGVTVELSHKKVNPSDCVDCGELPASAQNRKIDRIERRISFQGDLTNEERQKLLEIANKCPVHKTLEHSAVVVTKMDA
jgi:uncharacterized OsmC-like protein